MSVETAIGNALGDQGIASLANAFGLPQDKTRAVLATVGSELAWNLERNTLSRGGLADLINALGDGTHARLPDSPDAFGDAELRAQGDAILGHIVGTKDKSRGIAAYAARETGVSQGLIKQMLPYLASILMGVLANKAKGGLGDILSRLPNAGGAARPATTPGFGQDGPLTLPRSGANPGGYQGGSPLPIPSDDLRHRLPDGSNNPYGDLSDILRRGGGGVGSGSGGLWSIVRTVLGSVLGFGNRGVLGWFLTLIFSRFGWRILRFLLGRVFAGR